LSPGLQTAQLVHSAIEFSLKHPQETLNWHNLSNYIVCLSVADEKSLHMLKEKAEQREIFCVPFFEPDLNNQLTALTLEPCEASKKLCSNIPLALKEFTNKLQET